MRRRSSHAVTPARARRAGCPARLVLLGAALLLTFGEVAAQKPPADPPPARGTASPGPERAPATQKASPAPGPFPLPKLPKPARIIAIALHDEVSLGMASFVERIAAALTQGDVLLLDIKTFGGRVDAAVRIRDALLRTKEVGAKTVAFVNPRAISAGALIAYATDLIVVAPGATMGAATPIQVGVGGEAQPVEEKVVSYMRKEMRATALSRGRRGDVAEAMVDADVAVAGLVEKGKLLTLDGQAALEWGVASFEARSKDALLARLGYTRPGHTHRIRTVRSTWAERIASWLTSSAVSSLLMTVGMLGLMIGLYSGGSPIPLTVGASCLLLFFFGHHITQLAGIEDMLLFLLGLGLIAAEALLPGTFLLGTLGVLCVLAALFLGLVDFDKVPFPVQWASGLVNQALAIVFGSLFATVLLALLAVRLLPASRLGRPLILAEALRGRATDRTDGDPGLAQLVGQRGRARTDLRPVGKVELGDRRYDARAELGFISAQSEVEVVAARGLELVVRVKEAAEQNGAPSGAGHDPAEPGTSG